MSHHEKHFSQPNCNLLKEFEATLKPCEKFLNSKHYISNVGGAIALFSLISSCSEVIKV